MGEQKPFSGVFELINDTGLVCERFSDGSVSFDIFDAASQPGNDTDNLKYAVGIVKAVNNHDRLVGALGAYQNILRAANDGASSEIWGPKLEAAYAKARSLLAEVEKDNG